MRLEEIGIEIPKRTITALNKKNIYTADDLLRRLPRKYRDYREAKEVFNCTPGEYCAVRGVLREVEVKNGAKKYLSMKAETVSGLMAGGRRYISVLMFSRVFLAKKFYTMIGSEVVITGKVTYDDQWGYSISEPDDIVPAKDFIPEIMTIYGKVSGVTDEAYRKIVDAALAKVHEPFEWELMQKMNCTDYKTALMKLHHPQAPEDTKAYRRLLVNDLLYFSIGLKESQARNRADAIYAFEKSEQTHRFMQSLPFELTEDQTNAIESAIRQAAEKKRLNMLLQGDVGSGKTAVAIAVMMLARENGVQSVLMAPRGVLAAQHYETVKSMTGLGDEIAFLHSGLKAAERKELLKRIADGSVSMIIGTHSCIADAVHYHKLGLVVTDEEHLFGVSHKEKLAEKVGEGLHTISMSATPIPRTLASVIYGEGKEIIQIRTMPKGRLPIKSAAIKDRTHAFPFLEKEISAGHQCYVVCPAIEDNEETDIVSLEEMEKIYRGYFEPKGVKIGVVNGKMEQSEVDAVMADFTAGKTGILMATTVIEVGVNVPNATVIMIEQAERFGLASLHQLRGRVGRSSLQSYCVLRSDDPKNERLTTICSTTDGFAIAEADLKMRGSGDLLGLQQAGINRYVDLMLSHPDLFKKLQPVAEFCVREGFGKNLVRLCDCSEVSHL